MSGATTPGGGTTQGGVADGGSGPGPGGRVSGPRPRTPDLSRLLSGIVIPAISIALALVVGAVMIIVAELLVPGRSFDLFLPLTAYWSLFNGAVGSGEGIVSTLVFTTPLILGGLAVGLGFKGGLFNIGAQGQFLIGALAAVAVGVAVSTAPPIVAIPLALAAGLLGGALWGFIPGVLKAVSGAHEVVTTIMLNYIAVGVLAAMVSGPLQ
ncbi:MAG TPA: hypothetical protein VEY67_09155, partial [Candidatus Dormibacteraeota bacterium]|nr:hypothetical protein [Candidatus Dormibacteraeota bacterium]